MLRVIFPQGTKTEWLTASGVEENIDSKGYGSMVFHYAGCAEGYMKLLKNKFLTAHFRTGTNCEKSGLTVWQVILSQRDW